MKNAFNIVSRAFVVAALLLTISTGAFANNNTDKTTQRAREAVENAAPDDWYTLAKAAEKCIDKGVNLKEAAEWLNKSLAIHEAAYNLGIKGDYYVMNKLPEKALEYYSKSIRVGKMEDPSYMDAETQEKILALVRQLG
uniref:Tetratricopeptide repeat protein n=1 Tax=Roseihalotalea indica TaxID=2867963 RepID=A0AA49JHC3_9BACT|nr:hypothetical protein K4G66_04770 [Tunicatimonas sp. TK19036]